MQTRFSTDAIARLLMASLENDLGYTWEGRTTERQCSPIDAYDLKKVLQIDGFFKKYIFQNDVYSSEELQALSLEKFLENQRRLSASPAPTDDVVLLDIIMRARGWMANALGEYNRSEHFDKCYFPRKSSVGTPMHKATLCERWQRGLTGSRDHLEWFTHGYLPWLGHSAPRSKKGQLLYPLTEVHELAATFVAKSHKSLRMIVPNTGIGGLYSNGLGRVLESRLKAAGYDISILPEKHKQLARFASKHGRLATIDQSLASDNITCGVVKMLCPHIWTSVLMKGRIGLLRLPDGSTIETETMSMMGVGFTFPLQTLIFLSLVHACYDAYIAGMPRSARPERIISVFGDDVICPSELKGLVQKVFDYLGFRINSDKSFWSGAFKESCGGDYYHGYDVRPAFLPQGGMLHKRGYESFLYKTFNALHARWSLTELPNTVELILTLLPRKFVVPPHFGDDCGLKLTLEEADALGLKTPRRNRHGTFTFPYLSSKGRQKEVKYHAAYYWRSLHVTDRECHYPSDTLDRIDILTGVSRTRTSVFVEERASDQPATYRSKLTGRRLVKQATLVPIPGDSSMFSVQQATTFAWVA